LIQRAGKDPIILDTRPLSVIMNDCIPYDRWEKEKVVINRAGYPSWFELLKARADAKN